MPGCSNSLIIPNSPPNPNSSENIMMMRLKIRQSSQATAVPSNQLTVAMPGTPPVCVRHADFLSQLSRLSARSLSFASLVRMPSKNSPAALRVNVNAMIRSTGNPKSNSLMNRLVNQCVLPVLPKHESSHSKFESCRHLSARLRISGRPNRNPHNRRT